MKLRYPFTFQLNDTELYHQFTGNGLFDPDITATGAQPVGFDQMMAMYNYYRCWGAKMTLHGCAITALENVMFIHADISATIPSATLGYAGPCLPDYKYGYLQGNYSTVGESQPSPARARTMKMYRSTTKMFKKDRSALMTSLYNGTSSSNPSSIWYFYCGMWSFNDTASTGVIDCHGYITYYVEFYEKLNLGPS